MNESIVWLYQREAHDLNNCGIRAAELAQLDPVPAGFVIIASAVGEARRSGRLPSDLRTEIMHAYHRLIIFGGTYLPFVKLVASPVVTSDEIPSPIILQLGGKAVLTKIEVSSQEVGSSRIFPKAFRNPISSLGIYLQGHVVAVKPFAIIVFTDFLHFKAKFLKEGKCVLGCVQMDGAVGQLDGNPLQTREE